MKRLEALGNNNNNRNNNERDKRFENTTESSPFRFAPGTTAAVHGPSAVGSRSAVKIECGKNQGTATCVYSSDSTGLQLFVTCAHVVDHKLQSVVLRHDGRAIQGEAVYATGRGSASDVALIVCSSEPNARVEPCRMSDNVPTPGQKVVAVGYDLAKYSLSTVHGSVFKVSNGQLLTTCRVRKGFSGGPVFAADLRLLGLTVGMMSGLMHVAVLLLSPEFMGAVQKYILTNDVKELVNLESTCPLKIMIWKNGIMNCHI